MEERVRIFLLNQQISVELNSLLNLDLLIPESRIRQIRLPFQMKKFSINYKVLSVCMSYMISIQKNLSHSSSTSYRQKCVNAVSNYYIKKKMNFELYEYGYLCSKILCIALEKTMHVIYYMIYARFASKPYINHVIASCKQNDRRIKKVVRSENGESMNSQSFQSRHCTVYWENNQVQMDAFKKDLRHVLHAQGESKKSTKKTDNKRYFNLKNIYPGEENMNKEKSESDTSYFNQTGPKVVNIPSKVGSFDNSSVIKKLKYSSSNSTLRGSTSCQKLHMRRQRFNEDFDCAKKYELLAKDLEKRKKNQWLSPDKGNQGGQHQLGSIMKMQKHHYPYFEAMASNIKAKNKQLDNIRTQCMSQNKMTLKEFDWNRSEKTPDLRLKTADSCIRKEALNKTTQVLEKENNCQESKQFTIKKKSQSQIESLFDEMEPNKIGLITRKTDNFSQEEKLMLFSKKLKSKFKLQKYKHEYKQFLKTQMFDRSKNYS